MQKIIMTLTTTRIDVMTARKRMHYHVPRPIILHLYSTLFKNKIMFKSALQSTIQYDTYYTIIV